MGRGRQKAKQTRAARKLKYLTTDTNYSLLQNELSEKADSAKDSPGEGAGGDDLKDYASWAVQSVSKASLLKENPSIRSAMAKMIANRTAMNGKNVLK